MTSTNQALSDLITEFQTSLESWKGKPSVLLPSSLQFYRLGLVLAEQYPIDSRDNTNDPDGFQQVYSNLIEGFPKSALGSVLEDLHEAFLKLLERFENGATDETALQSAIQSLYGLYSTNHQILLDAASNRPISGWSPSKLQMMDAVVPKLQDNPTTKQQLLSLIAVFLEEPTLDFENLLPAMNQLQERKNKYEKSTWEELVLLQSSVDPEWKDRLVSRFTESTHQGYLLSMFQVEPEEEHTKLDTGTKYDNPHNPKPKAAAAKKVSAHDTIQRLVQQVRDVLPELGEGYCETALSHFQGDVERTLGALLEGQADPSSLPAVLQRLDPKLPARWKGTTSQKAAEEEAEARRITQEKVKALEQQQEAESRALERVMVTTHDEYNDDYDDQYDSIDGVGTADHGLYDDYDAVRTYNRMLKQVEEEQSFWEENRNDNRVHQKNSQHSNPMSGDGKKYRGPDKMKGGRIPRWMQESKSDDGDEEEESNNKNDNGGDNSSGGRGVRGNKGGRGRGGRGGRGGRWTPPRGGGVGGGGKGGDQSANSNNNNESSGGGGGGRGRGRGSARHKQNKLDSRRNKQKQAQAKRNG